jgi:hypothetical protein
MKDDSPRAEINMTPRAEINMAPRAEINMAKIPVSGDIAGLIFAAGTMIIFYWGIPAVRDMLPAAVIAGCGIAFALHFIHHDDPAPPILNLRKNS